MKRIFAILMAFALFSLTGSAAAQSAPDAGETETWYAQAGGAALCLALHPDGAYTLTLADEQTTGAWTEAEGYLYLDGAQTPTLMILGERLYWPDAQLFLDPQPPEGGAYAPDDLLSPADAALMNGYWVSQYVQVDGLVLPAQELNDRTDMYIEAPRAALGGPLFDDTLVTMTEQDGALSYTANGVTLTLALQQDALLRLSLATPEGDVTIYLERVVLEEETAE